ncbi:secretory carrier-associated membrane protein 1-like [Clavelina lepadiformis]|uniref:secretory carrier-associated membrane protein 1-like n=1 Tax=Clavelina lepadiformis TaxID=159417 RepID=UPI0040435814
MSGFDANPFADPFKDGSVTEATSTSNNANLDDYNPFANSGNVGSVQPSEPAVVQPVNPPPYSQYGSGVENSAPPVAASTPAPPIPGHEELLKRQEELERKAEELQRREQELNSSSYQPRKNNWPPLPNWCPVGPCFYQDFSVDIPSEFQRTVKMIYYLWIFYVIITFLNMLAAMAYFVVKPDVGGTQFGMSILWVILFTPCSLCWYRPVYSAFKSDSSFNFFIFFFMMFFQFCFSILMCVGIPGSGWMGWIISLTIVGVNIGAGIFCCIQAALYTVMAVFSLILLKKVHGIYRTTGASFEKAQKEFATGVMKNPGVQTAAAQAATSAVQGSLGGSY